MKKRYIGIAGLGLLLALGTQQVHAQQGFGTTEPDKSAAVDIQSSKRGLLIPRVNLTATDDKVTVKDPAQSLMVYNQATTTGEKLVTPGYYYWDTNRWVRFAQQGDFSEITLAGDVTGKVGETKVVALQGTAIAAVTPTANQVLVFVPGEGTNPGQWVPTSLPTQPWNVQGTNTKATENTQVIYQEGNVAIGFTKEDVATKNLQVKGDFKSVKKVDDNTYHSIESNTTFLNKPSTMIQVASEETMDKVLNDEKGEGTILSMSKDRFMLMTADFKKANGQKYGSIESNMLNEAAVGIRVLDKISTGEFMESRVSSIPASDGIILSHENHNGMDESITKKKSSVQVNHQTGITFNFDGLLNESGSYSFPKTSGLKNQVLVSSGSNSAGNSGPAKLFWTNIIDALVPGTAGQVLTTTKEGDNEPKVEWKAPAVHENIYTHDGTLVNANGTARIVDFGSLINMTFKKGNQSHQFTYDESHTGINMFGMNTSSINLIATDEKFSNKESKLQLFHNSTKSEINANSRGGLWITAGINQKITLGKRYFLPGENNARYDEYLEINDNGAVQVVNINKPEFKGVATDKVVVADATGVLKTTTAAMPKVFYMPPVMFNTEAIGTGKTRNLYNEYVAMYGGIGTVVDMPNRPGLVKNAGAENTTIPVFGVKELDFYVSYYDPEVFANVTVDNDGVLKYDVKKKAKYGSFMTIVFVVRDTPRQ